MPVKAIGTMSGTSMDGVDVALIETDGETIQRLGPSSLRQYNESEREVLRAALIAAKDLNDRSARPGALADAERLVTQAHAEAIESFLAENKISAHEIGVVGFHGQTVLHRPEKKLTVQIGDGAALAKRLGISVVYDFRAADVSAGGQGAPFVPVYHRALARIFSAKGPLIVVNIGGVANVTYLDGEADPIAFDTGPGNAPMDDLVRERSAQPMDRDGILAAAGKIDEARVTAALRNPFFGKKPPKSLDRADFARFDLDGLSLEDAAATATAITAASIALARNHFPKEPRLWIAAGGGAHNPTLMKMLAGRLSPAAIKTADAVGWQVDAVEAQAFAYLAVRSLKKMPLTFPTTTGVATPLTGGVLAKP